MMENIFGIITGTENTLFASKILKISVRSKENNPWLSLPKLNISMSSHYFSYFSGRKVNFDFLLLMFYRLFIEIVQVGQVFRIL